MSRKKNDELKSHSFLIVNENTVLPFETLTQEQRNEYIPRIMKNIGDVVSDYYNCHADEAFSYLEYKQMVRDNLTNAVAELDRHLNCMEVQNE